MSDAQRSMPRYYPPSYDVLMHFARAVGDELGDEYADPCIVQGLADFMGTVAQMLAHDLNRKHPSAFDTGIE